MKAPHQIPADLLDQVEGHTPEEVTEAGYQLADEGRVGELMWASTERLIATVDDGVRCEVTIEFGPTLSMRCPCRPGQSEFCAHTWAVLAVAIEEQAQRGAGASGAVRPGGTIRDDPSQWKRLLNNLEQSSFEAGGYSQSPWKANQKILYMLEVVPAHGLSVLPVVTLHWGTRQRSKAGWNPLARRKVYESDRPEGMDPVDWAALRILCGLTPQAAYRTYEGMIPSSVRCPIELAALVIPVLARTGRLVVAGTENRHVPEVLTWDAGEVWNVALDASPGGKDGVADIAPVLMRGEERHRLGPDARILFEGVARIGTTLVRVDETDAGGWIDARGAGLPLLLPTAALPQALERLSRIRGGPPLAKKVSGLTERTGPPVPVLALAAPRETHIDAYIEFAYGPSRIRREAPGPRTPLAATREIVVRDEESERRRLSELEQLQLRVPKLGPLTFAAARLPALVEALDAAGWIVEAERNKVRAGGRFTASISSGIDWFDLSGILKFDGAAAALPAVLAALRKKSLFVRLDDGTLGLLPEAWLARFRLFDELATSEGDALRFRRAQQGFLDGCLEGAAVAVDDAYAEARAALGSFEGIEREQAPDGFTGELRPYQEEGLGWMVFLDRFGFGGCLADDMGLGKTVQVLALLARLQAQPPVSRPAGLPEARPPTLIVMPRSLLFNWKAEAARFAPRLRVLVHHGPERSKDVRALQDHHLILTTYGTLRRDADLLGGLKLDYLVIDEAQAVKNADTATARALRTLTSRRRLAVTGTPVENHLGELANLMDFLNPGFFGSRRSIPGGDERLEPELAATLRSVLRPFLLRRTKGAVDLQLPARTEQTLICQLEPDQRALYDELREHFRTELLTRPPGGGQQLLVLEALLRLRQVACHPGLVNPELRGAASAKLDALIPQLAEVLEAGHKALVFSQFTQLLSIVRERLDAEKICYEYLDGQVQDREARVARFQSDASCGVFLISLRAGGVGLNLTAAEYVYILDPWWNPAVEAQAIDRAHRIGQTRPVVAYRLVAQDTVEERILELQARKRELADAILGEESGPLAGLTREDLERLLG